MKKNKKLYRLTLVEDETHERIASFRFSRLSGTVSLITLLVLILGMAWCLIAFTPVRSMIPGYPDAYSKNIAVRNAIKIDSLENIITRWEFYAENLSRVLTGEETISMDSIVKDNPTRFLKDISEEQMREADSLLRRKVRQEGGEQ